MVYWPVAKEISFEDISIFSSGGHGHIVTGDLNIITDSRIRSIICKGPKYRFPVPIDLKSCREKIAGALQQCCNHCCKREHVESNVLNSWKLIVGN